MSGVEKDSEDTIMSKRCDFCLPVTLSLARKTEII